MCGFIGVYGPDGVDVAPELYEGLLAIQHRGQDAAGIITFTDTFHVKKGAGLVRDAFSEADMLRLRGNLGLGHVRYPTVGLGSLDDAQPFHVNFPLGVAMAHNGNVTNFLELKEFHGQNSGTRLNSSCDLEVILYVFVRALAERVPAGQLVRPADVFAAVKAVHEQVRGAYSVVAVLPDVGLVAFRDPFGIKPMVMGVKRGKDGPWFAVASESVALDVCGYRELQDVHAGEAVLVDAHREVHRQQVSNKPHRPCIFELVYFARPDSMLDRISVYRTRTRFGQALAQQWKERKAPLPDVVIPIPDSSRDAAMAMAAGLGLPYREGLVKNRYIGRTFIMPSESSRQTSVRRKLNAIPLEFQGKDVLLVDDSIVRGNTARRIVRMAREAGAKKVYFASAAPPVRYPNVYGIDMPAAAELVAAGRTVEQVQRKIGADWLVYQDLDDLVAAVRHHKADIDGFDTSCFSGEYVTGDVSRAYLDGLEVIRSNSAKARRDAKARAEESEDDTMQVASGL